MQTLLRQRLQLGRQVSEARRLLELDSRIGDMEREFLDRDGDRAGAAPPVPGTGSDEDSDDSEYDDDEEYRVNQRENRVSGSERGPGDSPLRRPHKFAWLSDRVTRYQSLLRLAEISGGDAHPFVADRRGRILALKQHFLLHIDSALTQCCLDHCYQNDPRIDTPSKILQLMSLYNRLEEQPRAVAILKRHTFPQITTTNPRKAVS